MGWAWVPTLLLGSLFPAATYGSQGCSWANGVLSQSSPAPGLLCLNWREAQSRRGQPPAAAEDHNYCRNPDGAKGGPWCYVSGEAGAPEKRTCDPRLCPAPSLEPLPRTPEAERSQEAKDDIQVFAPASSLPSGSEAAAVQSVIGISQRVRMNPKEKKDLGTLGSVLGVSMIVIIIAIGAGIVLGYIYKRGKDLKEQHEQRMFEREMQRITLPLSAFTNPSCEIVDEMTVVIHTNPTPVEDVREGNAPLMGQAGTPGA
ncbi:phosphoinositide-3-kinase-interacting protein 1 [Ornithorhynchus anatinus]|uniref:Phosphoinositide-3-kinase interacting protein 1 n=1 Tax=Ornithorhynchus anatinus TaxID=9258 RepID=A0A6I8MX77_ORNAN|nr:phosphoinositide-3-kinase-interacting protein 1 [Ornithorhynchus anatinus]